MKCSILPAFLAAFFSAAIASEPSGAPSTATPEGVAPRHSVQTRRKVPPAPAPGVTLCVSPQGDDAAAGSEAHPFRSLQRCRDAIRALRKKGPLPKGGVLVVIHGGEYPVTGTFSLSAEDSGEEGSPIRYVAAPGEKPVFYGGKRLTSWRHLADADAYPLVAGSVRKQIWVADLKASGVERVLPLKLGGAGSGNGFVTHPAHELFFNGSAMQLSRGPNRGWLHIKDVEVKDGTKGYDRQGSKTGIFTCDGLPAKWAKEPDLLLYGYWFWNWSDSYERVASIDAENHRIALAQPWHKWGFSIGAPFYAVNALSELDAPGEWYLDRARNAVLFYPPSAPSEAEVEISVTPAPFLAMENVSHVRFEGISWDLGSADGIRIKGGDHCLLAGCHVSRFAGNGVEIRDARDTGLLSCDIASMGRGGIILTGGGRRDLKPGGNFVENCEIHDLSRIDHTYTPGILLEGAGNRVAHNRLHDIPSSAMRIEGNDQVIEYNEAYNVVTESDDQGAVDMWGNPTYRGNVIRFNYWHHIGAWRDTEKQPKCGQNGVRLDDAICGVLIYGNVFERCASGGFGAVQIHGGKDNTVENNLFLDCARCITAQPWTEERWFQYVREILERKEINEDLYRSRYPEMVTIRANPNANLIRGNLTLRCAVFLPKTPPEYRVEANDGLLENGFTMATAPTVYEHPGIRAIPLGEIGLYTDAWRK